MSEVAEIKPEKPTDVPRYYSLRGIKNVPGHDWEFDDTQNSWVWKATPEESAQFEAAEEEYSKRFTRTAATRQDYGQVRYKGEPHVVWEDSKGNEWIHDYETHEKIYLKPDWWSNPEKRKDAVLSIDRVETPDYEGKKSFWAGDWLPKMPDMPSMPSMPKMPEFKPTINIGSPELSTGTKAGLSVGLLLIGGVILLLAIGYSGLGGSLGRVGEKEHKRARK